MEDWWHVCGMTLLDVIFNISNAFDDSVLDHPDIAAQNALAERISDLLGDLYQAVGARVVVDA